VTLYLDEMIRPDVAGALREQGHDVVGAAECGMLGASDAAQFARAIHERRALVTHNVRDFAILARGAGTAGRAHWGVVLINDRHLPPSDIGGLVNALGHFLTHHEPDLLKNAIVFLRRAGN
jgi:predicted nuclease of predicted toxin-antitoxin system